ncbi:hypothetical protein D641_0113050 [Brachybacterium muris UCD-AY4]|uniref:Uncharacterized protein n=1 Tax=Brachybacterium muris UCD-AY4 TaxID=1249481 RepID=A0A022KRK3_9MICO|nr:hypothetical protein D641_0113050 [Brachybacterium muris UCD-AY4]
MLAVGTNAAAGDRLDDDAGSGAGAGCVPGAEGGPEADGVPEAGLAGAAEGGVRRRGVPTSIQGSCSSQGRSSRTGVSGAVGRDGMALLRSGRLGDPCCPGGVSQG